MLAVRPRPLTSPLAALARAALQAFQGRHGRAYLFNTVSNITLGNPEDRVLLTGRAFTEVVLQLNLYTFDVLSG